MRFTARLGQHLRLRLGAGARRVEDRGIDILQLLESERRVLQVARFGGDAMAELRALGSLRQCSERRLAAFDRMHLADLRKIEGEGAGAGIELRDALGLADHARPPPPSRSPRPPRSAAGTTAWAGRPGPRRTALAAGAAARSAPACRACPASRSARRWLSAANPASAARCPALGLASHVISRSKPVKVSVARISAASPSRRTWRSTGAQRRH